MTIIISIFSFIFGSVIASFLGVVSYRVPKKLSIVKPDSHCPSCGHMLKWYENIPVLSYIFLGGKCSKCGSKIGIFGFILELLGGLSFMSLYLVFGFSLEFYIGIPLVCLFLVIAGIDYETNDIYDITSLLFLIITTIYIVIKSILIKEIPYNELITFVITFLLFYLFRYITTKIYKQEAFGLGDVFLIAIGGLLVGGFGIVLALLVASLSALLVEGIKVVFKLNRNNMIAFGPYLLLGIFIAYLFTDYILKLLVL